MTKTNSQDATRYLALSDNLVERAGVKPTPGGDKAFTDALISQMRTDKLLSVSVPPAFGGPGLELAEIARITFNVARQNGSAGLIYAMHMSQAMSVTAHGTGPFFAAFQHRMIDEQILIASGTSEKGPGGDIFTSICNVEDQADGRLRIVKESPNISYIDNADAILVSANGTDEKGRTRQVLAVANVNREAFKAGRDTSFMGMVGILNRPWAFTVEFPRDAVFSEAFPAIARGTMTPVIQILWAALWSGLAWTALDRARTFVSKELEKDAETTQIARYELNRLTGQHHIMNSLIRSAMAEYKDRDAAADMGFSLSARINRLKVECSDIACRVCQGALMLIGIRGYATSGPYSVVEPVADALSAPIMVSNYRLSMNTAKIEGFVDETL
ncbi:acyl-CoA dehydrogenase family protein [Roseobacter sp.]|uniref:acyl-CoA dehydrogenase family protein n=1 Tax=Roseobacter sp. TaxID=1907202 RepID=UPI00385B4D4B